MPLTDAQGDTYVIKLHYQTRGGGKSKSKQKSKAKTIDWRLYHCVAEVGGSEQSTGPFKTAIESLEAALGYIGAPTPRPALRRWIRCHDA